MSPGLSPPQRLFCVVGRLGRKKKEARGTMGRGKREERLLPLPSSRRSPRAFYVFFFLVIAMFIGIPSGSFCWGERALEVGSLCVSGILPLLAVPRENERKISSYSRTNCKHLLWWQVLFQHSVHHKMASYTWNFHNFTCVFVILVKFDIYFLGFPLEIVGVITDKNYIIYIILKKVKTECDILVQGFCPLKVEITQFRDGFRLNMRIQFLKIPLNLRSPPQNSCL